MTRTAPSVREETFAAFHAAYGSEPPWPCAYVECGELVHFIGSKSGADSGLLHHVDEDWTNNVPGNVVPMHRGCHRKHHQTGKTYSPERVEAAAAGLRGRKHSDEAKARMRVPKGPMSDAERQKRSDALKRYWATKNGEQR